MRRLPATLLLLVMFAPLAACAAAKDYPSLQRRPAERMTSGRQAGSATPVSPEASRAPPAAPGRQLVTRLAQLVDQARAAHKHFAGRRANTERLVAEGGGGTPGSEGWSVATVALSDLESSRSDAILALADLDDLYTTETIAASQTGDQTRTTAIAGARDQVVALVGEEDDVLARLRDRMRS
jgi:hypothetical protein